MTAGGREDIFKALWDDLHSPRRRIEREREDNFQVKPLSSARQTSPSLPPPRLFASSFSLSPRGSGWYDAGREEDRWEEEEASANKRRGGLPLHYSPPYYSVNIE